MNLSLIQKELSKSLKSAKIEIEKTNSSEEIKLFKSNFLNKNKILNDAKKLFPSLDNNERKILSETLKSYNTSIYKLIEIQNSNLDRKEKEKILAKVSDEYLNLEIIKQGIGTYHPLSLLSKMVKDFFYSHGFSFSSPIEIEEENLNFDSLNIPKGHPARAANDTYYLENKNYLLRPQCTNMTIRKLKENNDDQIKFFTIGKVYRNDSDDATHSHQFQQIDVFNVSKNSANLANLKWIIIKFLNFIFEDQEIKIRFRPSFFPFTTPSLEVDISYLKNSKDNSKEEWLEILGCGMLHPNVLIKANKDPNVYTGYAMGIGLERLAILKWGIKDIRHLYENDIDFLRTFKV